MKITDPPYGMVSLKHGKGGDGKNPGLTVDTVKIKERKAERVNRIDNNIYHDPVL